ncbi:hypothetical protein ACFU5Y_18820 [Streptomyces gardneri]|uniref:hypothetical protein n=1 Tax=Streptomyces gardneri TaxID=66892 RepID=UPI00367BC93C
MTRRKARLPAIGLRWYHAAEIAEGLILIGCNAAGLGLAGSLVIDEVGSTREFAAVSVPDLEPHAEEQPQPYAASATASSLAYRYEAPATRPVHQPALPSLYSDAPHEGL